MKKENLILLVAAPIFSNNLERWGVDYFEKDFNVYIADLRTLLRRGRVEEIYFNDTRKLNVHQIETLNDFKNLVDKVDFTLAIDFIDFSITWLKLYKILKKHSVKLFIQKLGSIPSIGIERRDYIKIKKEQYLKSTYLCESKIKYAAGFSLLLFLAKIIFIRLKDKVEYKYFYYKFKKIDDVGAFIAGEKSLSSLLQNCNPVIWTASNDYYKYIENTTMQSKYNFESKYILFIDDGVTAAFDFKTLNMTHIKVTELYFESLKAFLDNLELKYSAKILIAGHPDLELNENYRKKLEKFEIHFGKTPQLVANSLFVLTHASTAVSFAILAKKPILFVTSAELNRSFYCKTSIFPFAEYLGRTPINIDFFNDEEIEDQLAKPMEYYDSWRRDFIINKDSVPERQWESLLEYVKNCQASRNKI